MKALKQVNVHQAKTQLSKLLADVEKGEEIVVARNGTPVAKLIPFPKPAKTRLRIDNWKGRIWTAPDWDAPLTDEELKDWGY